MGQSSIVNFDVTTPSEVVILSMKTPFRLFNKAMVTIFSPDFKEVVSEKIRLPIILNISIAAVGDL